MAVTFRLMTVNLLHEHSDPVDFVGILERHDPDVVVTQELGPIAADILASVYEHHRLRPALGFAGRGIATRFPAEFADIDMPGRDGTAAILEIFGRRVWLAGVHLLNPIHFPWWRSARARGRQLHGLFEWMSRSEEPLMVAGDLNASPRWPAFKQMTERVDDLVADWALREGTVPERTWAWRPGWPRLLRIDHVFGAGMKADHVEVDTIGGTDHNPLVVDLSLD
jgi:endonuclease/exonuclease/phosphatase (EEP) superfamily protein YafD